jgi:hypothetical protein
VNLSLSATLRQNIGADSIRCLRRLLAAAITAGTLIASSLPRAQAQSAGEVLKNGGFEGGGGADGQGAGIPRWNAWGVGYDVDRTEFHSGEQSARCDALRADKEHGVVQEVILNQKRPSPILISGWSKADKVSGVKDADYALYIDLEYADGTPLYGQVSPFRSGTHGWERRTVLVTPSKPVRRMNIIGLFRKHAGTVWFDDFSANQMDGAGIFDGQALLPLPQAPHSGEGALRVRGADGLNISFDSLGTIAGVKAGELSVGSGARGGFWVRDVATAAGLAPLRGTCAKRGADGLTLTAVSDPMQLKLNARLVPEHGAISVDGEIYDLTKMDRAVTVYFTLPVNADGWSWGRDIRNASVIKGDEEQSNLTHVNVGAVSGMSLYPVGCVYNQQTGIAISNQQDMPSVCRIFYNGPTKQLVIAWDFALTGKTGSWPKYQAHFHASLFSLPTQTARYGFRAAMQRFYAINSPNYDRFAKQDGIWAPFVSPTTVQGYQDFGFAYHEGDNSKKADNAAGILNFRYTEPMTWWMPMPAEMPRTYENALTVLNGFATRQDKIGPDTPRPTPTELAKAVLNSGSKDENGNYNLEFRKEPWGDGAVFVLNPNPELPASEQKPTRGYLNYNSILARKLYQDPTAIAANGRQDGEYLDSLEGWSDVLDYRPESLAGSPYPLTFETDSRKPCLPQWYSTHCFARFLRDDLHNRGKLLMANSTPVKYTCFAALLDVMGIEVNWLTPQNTFMPDSDEVMNLRRTMSGARPYLLLMNTRFAQFPASMVEQYFQISMFYGIFPSMFSENAAEHPYWENPTWYNRDRPLFKKYIPIIKRLSAAGWEPVPFANTTADNIAIERFGTSLFTLRNLSSQAATAEVRLDARALHLTNANSSVVDLITGAALKSNGNGSEIIISINLKPGECTAIEVK